MVTIQVTFAEIQMFITVCFCCCCCCYPIAVAGLHSLVVLFLLNKSMLPNHTQDHNSGQIKLRKINKLKLDLGKH